MAEHPLTHSPGLGTDSLDPTASYNPDPTPKEEPQEQLAIPAFMTQLPGPVGNLMDTEMTDVAVSQAVIPNLACANGSSAIPSCPSSFSDTYVVNPSDGYADAEYQRPRGGHPDASQSSSSWSSRTALSQ